MKEIKSVKKWADDNDYLNEITEKLDECLREDWKGTMMDTIGFCTYMLFRRHDGAAIRYPGATRGHVNFDKDHIITEVHLYADTAYIYKEDALEELKKFIGSKLILPEGIYFNKKH